MFQSKKIFLNKESVAEQLRSTRQKKEKSLIEVAKLSNINLKYLQALESGEYQKLPSGIYGLNFLKQYAFFLGLNYNKLREKFLEEQKIYESQKNKQLFSRQVVSKKYFWSMPQFIKSFLIVLLGLVCLIYLFFLLKNIFISPDLKLFFPPKNLVTEQRSILIKGRTEPEVNVLINNVQAIVLADGQFSKMINLKEGINKITIIAERKGNKKTIFREILLKTKK